MKVVKFGGSSVANDVQIKKAGSIIEDDTDRKFIVVSAPGKRFEDDVKITDLLIELSELVLNNKSYEKKFKEIMERFSEIVNKLELPESILADNVQSYHTKLKNKARN